MTTRREACGLMLGLPALAALGLPETSEAAAATGTGAQMKPKTGGLMIGAHEKLLMIGDSITDVERARPIGEGRDPALGRGYVAMVDALLGAVYADQWIRVVNMGISGNTTRDLKARWQTDVLDLKPDWLSIMIGANDVWRQFDSPKQTEKHVLIDEYEKNLDELITQTKPMLKGLVLFTPYYIEPNKQDAMRATMDKYGAVVKKLASKYNAILVDTQAAFDEVLKIYYPATIKWDRVHPNYTGSAVIARAFLDAVGFDWKRHL
jgi:lysophospholipase L1-like esterase